MIRVKSWGAALALGACALALATGCGNDCDDAAARIDECGLENGSDVDLEECNDRAAAMADCMSGLSCDDLKGPKGTACVSAAP